jgi:WD40 repeat protein
MSAILAYVALIAVKEAANARRALALAYFSQAQATRQSGITGQRTDSLKALEHARPYYTNESVLRDEAIACLALADLKSAPERDSARSAGVHEMSMNWGVSATGETNGTITLRGPPDGQVLQSLPGCGLPVTKIRFGPKHPVLLAGYAGGAKLPTTLWDWQTGRELFSLPDDIQGQAVDFSADGQRLAIGQARGGLIVYALPEGTKLLAIELRLDSGRPRVPQAIRFNPTGDLLAESSLDNQSVQVWGLEPGLAARTPLVS